MPLRYTSHEPHELMVELRSLWNQADSLRTLTKHVSLARPLGDPLPPKVVIADEYVRSFWVQLSTDSTKSLEQQITRVATINYGYTILHAYLFVVSRPDAGPVTFRGQLYAVGDVADYIGDGSQVQATDPDFGQWSYATGVLRQQATEISGDWTAKPIYPTGLSHLLNVQIDIDWGGNPVRCYHAVVFGLYVLHGSAFFDECPT